MHRLTDREVAACFCRRGCVFLSPRRLLQTQLPCGLRAIFWRRLNPPPYRGGGGVAVFPPASPIQRAKPHSWMSAWWAFSAGRERPVELSAALTANVRVQHSAKAATAVPQVEAVAAALETRHASSGHVCSMLALVVLKASAGGERFETPRLVEKNRNDDGEDRDERCRDKQVVAPHPCPQRECSPPDSSASDLLGAWPA